MITLSCCNFDDPYTGEPLKEASEPSFDLSTELGKLQDHIYNRFGIELLATIDTSLYVYNMTSVKIIVEGDNVGHHISKAEPDQVVHAINFLETEVFGKLGEPFVKKYLPRRIMFLNMCGYYTSSDLLDGMQPGVRMYPGYGELSIGCIALAGVSSDFQNIKDKTKITRAWLSLIIEKAFSRLPFPKQFAELYDKGSKLDDFSTIQLGDLHNYGFICNYRKSFYLEGVHQPDVYVSKLSLEQDFGDFMAAVLVLTKTELDELKGISPLIASKIEVAQNYKNLIINSITK